MRALKLPVSTKGRQALHVLGDSYGVRCDLLKPRVGCRQHTNLQLKAEIEDVLVQYGAIAWKCFEHHLPFLGII